MKKKDIILIGIILSIAIVGFGFNFYINGKESDKIEIYVDNELYQTYDIDDEDELKIETDNGYNIIKIHDGGAEMIEASCPDQICVGEGIIHKHSESIVCLPNKINIKITGDNQDNDSEDVLVK